MENKQWSGKTQMWFYEVMRLIGVLEKKIDESGCKEKLKYVHGIPLGGLVPAAILGYRFDLEYNSSFPLYKGKPEELLVVDDVNETGKTLESYADGHMTAVLIQRNTSPFKADFVGEEVSHKNYIVFPWEKYI